MAFAKPACKPTKIPFINYRQSDHRKPKGRIIFDSAFWYKYLSKRAKDEISYTRFSRIY